MFRFVDFSFIFFFLHERDWSFRAWFVLQVQKGTQRSKLFLARTASKQPFQPSQTTWGDRKRKVDWQSEATKSSQTLSKSAYSGTKATSMSKNLSAKEKKKTQTNHKEKENFEQKIFQKIERNKMRKKQTAKKKRQQENNNKA